MKAPSEDLLELSGMAYHGGHDAQHWIDLVGVDPRQVDGVYISKAGFCFLSPEGRERLAAYFRVQQFEMRMLTSL